MDILTAEVVKLLAADLKRAGVGILDEEATAEELTVARRSVDGKVLGRRAGIDWGGIGEKK